VRDWREIVEPYRAEAWHECTRIAREIVDDDPYDLSARALLASLLVKSDNRALALLQYERLLPLSIGRADLVRSLGTQRRLDELHPALGHVDRFRAMHEWFRRLVPELQGAPAPSATRRGESVGGALAPLISLSADAFSTIAERARVIPLDLAAHSSHAPEGLLWAVYFGRIRWTVVHEADDRREAGHVAASGILHLAAGEDRRIEFEAEIPTEVIELDTAVAEVLWATAPERMSEPTE
jgi:hypothetical protein